MDNILKRIYASLGANLSTQVLTILIQLTAVPIFLSQWSLEQYGQWLMLTAIPTYFALSDFGFLTVIVNKMTILAGEQKFENVKSLFHSAIMLCLVVNSFSLIVVVFVAFFLNVEILSN